MIAVDLHDIGKTVDLIDYFDDSTSSILKLQNVMTICISPDDVVDEDTYLDENIYCKVHFYIKSAAYYNPQDENDEYTWSNLVMTDLKNLRRYGTIYLKNIKNISDYAFKDVPKLSAPSLHFLYHIKESLIDTALATYIVGDVESEKYDFGYTVGFGAKNKNSSVGKNMSDEWYTTSSEYIIWAYSLEIL